jgi:hypothetical protein
VTAAAAAAAAAAATNQVSTVFVQIKVWVGDSNQLVGMHAFVARI